MAQTQVCHSSRRLRSGICISDPSRAGGSDGQIGSGLYSLGFEQFEFEMIRCSEVQPKSVFSTQQNLGHHALKKREVSARAG